MSSNYDYAIQINNRGIKNDQGKLRVDLLSPDSLLGIARILGYGSTIYGDRNWELGLLYSRVYAATLRHILKFWGGENIDEDSGLSHLDHAACCIHFLQHYEKNKNRYQTFDDRPDKETKNNES